MCDRVQNFQYIIERYADNLIGNVMSETPSKNVSEKQKVWK
mgnify:CR=1 FL=1|jgi:hypothetical protein